MTKYHLNTKGEPGICKATIVECPFGGADKHYPTKDMARQHYEFIQAEESMVSVSKGSKMTNKAYVNAQNVLLELRRNREWKELQTAERAEQMNQVYAEAKRRQDVAGAAPIFSSISSAYKYGAGPEAFKRIAPTLEALPWQYFREMTSDWDQAKKKKFFENMKGVVSDEAIKFWQREKPQSVSKFKVPVRPKGYEYETDYFYENL